MHLLQDYKIIKVRTISKTFLKSLNYGAYFCKDNNFKKYCSKPDISIMLNCNDILQVLSFFKTFCELFLLKNITCSQNKN